jgi:PAS domain S-box-containing protein
MKARLRTLLGVRLGIAIQVFTTLLILAVGYFIIERNLSELLALQRPISPFQLKMVMVSIRAEVLLVALLAFVSGLILTFTIRREVKRAADGVEKLSKGVMEPALPGDLSQEFVPLESAIRNLGEALNRFLDRSVTDAIVLVNEDLTVELLNPTAELLFGYSSEEVEGSPVGLLFPEDDANSEIHAWLGGSGAGLRGEALTGSIRTRKGERVPVRLGTFQVRRQDRRVRGIVAGVFDEEGWRRIREEFDRAGRLSALGLLVSGLAHEIKNPLGAISGLVQMLAEDVPPDHPQRRYYDTIQQEVQRLNGIMERLLDLAAPSQWERREVSLQEVATEVAVLMEGKARQRGVGLGGGSGDSDAKVIGDRGRIKQAVLNVMKNAIEATPQGGQVQWCLQREEGWGVISVTNPGAPVGVPLSSRVDSPLSSSKIGGSGLGLAITHQILYHHRGQLQVRDLDGKGTQVRLLFPLMGDPGERPRNGEEDSCPSLRETPSGIREMKG